MSAPEINGVGQGYASGVVGFVQRSVDRVAPPSSRQKAYDDVSAFATARPLLFVLLASQLLFSLLPLLLFTTFAVSATATAFTAAALFSLFWIGVAFAVLVPALLIAGAAALLFSAWVVGSFLVTRWLYHRVPWAAPETNGHRDGGNETWAQVVAKDERGSGSHATEVKQEQ